MSLRLFNSMTKQKEEFVPLRPGKVGIYVCGVTVYDHCHVGHARAYVAFDVVVRWLRRDHQVTYVRNFTDVDDKIIRRAAELNEPPLELASRFADAFHEDMAAINVKPADIEPRVSTHMDEIVEFVGALVDQGFAYRVPTTSAVDDAGDDVYFRVKRFDRYTELSGRHMEDLQAGARISVDERKEDGLDFALWKSAKPGEIWWPSPFGHGRPGWHIECSAMSRKHLGVTFDIHGGGKDLLFPHHTNEVAQSECRHGEVMARYWLHNGFVNVEADDDQNGEYVEEIDDGKGGKVKVVKMSKSLDNFFTIREVLARYTGEALRWLLLQTQYRGPIAFSARLVEESERRVQYLYETHRRIDETLHKQAPEEGPSLEFALSKPGEPFRPWHDFVDAMEDDFATPRAMAALIELLRVANLLVVSREKELGIAKLSPGVRSRLLLECQKLLHRMSEVLGVGEQEPKPFLESQRTLRLASKAITRDTVEQLIRNRSDARAAKDFAAADKARADLTALGIEVRDTADGAEWSVI
jgi:cysteinyl-tRNA synthetase